MKILHEIFQNGTAALRFFTSEAEPRKNRQHIHYHSFIEFSVIESGSGLYTAHGNSYPITPGSIFFFRPNEAHFVSDVEAGGMRFFNLHVAPYYLYTDMPGGADADYTKILSTDFPLKSHRINDVLPEGDVVRISSLLRLASEELSAKAADHRLMVNSCILSALVLLSRAFGAAERTAPSEWASHRRLLGAIAYMDTHFASDITLEEIAAEAGYSRCYFSSVFRQCMGMSAWDYICLKRIEAASALIKTTDKSILEIATECGFNNAVNFYKTFKRYTNLAPGALRK